MRVCATVCEKERARERGEGRGRARDLKHDVGLNLTMPEDSIALVVVKFCLVVKDHLIVDRLSEVHIEVIV